MIDIPVVLVLGAGASHPYGFPLGTELRNIIVGSTLGDSSRFRDLIRQSGFEWEEFVAFQSELLLSRFASVDAFLEHRKEFVQIGKTAMAYVLIGRETEKRLFGAKHDWYQYLLGMMLTDGFDGFGTNELAVITYNYDRSLEYTFLHALSSGFGKPHHECARAMRQIPVVHLHGQLGFVEELIVGEEGARKYGSELSPLKLRTAAESIHVVDGVSENSQSFQDAQDLIAKARHIIFLGFGFLPINVRRLHLSEVSHENAEFHGTGVGLTGAEVELIRPMFPPRKLLINTGVTDVLQYIRGHATLFQTT